MQKIVCISDTHGKHKKVKIPKCDILIHAGDFSSTGKHDEVERFLRWLNKQPAEHIIFCAGNHDLSFDFEPEFKEEMLRKYVWGTATSNPRIHYLEDSSIICNGLHFYGMPWCPRFGNWAFYFESGSKELQEKCSSIPLDTDILITHGPPWGVLDLTYSQTYAGSQALRNRIHSLNLKYHVFGHIHEGYGSELKGTTMFVNASTCDAFYDPKNKPVIIEV